MSEELDLLRRAVEEPVAQMLLAEVTSPTHSSQVARQIREWVKLPRPTAEFGFNANRDDASELWERCREAAAGWDENDPGLLVIHDDSPPLMRIEDGGSKKPTSIGFWRTMNQLREKWDSLPSQTVFLVTSGQYLFLTTEADHFKRWIPLKVHLPKPDEVVSHRRIASHARAYDDSLTVSLPSDDLEGREAANKNRDIYQGRLREAIKRGESPQTLARRYYLPLMAATIALQKWPEAANYNRLIQPFALTASQQLRWLRLRSRLEEAQGRIVEATATATQRLELSQAIDAKGSKEDLAQQYGGAAWNTLSAVHELYLLHERHKNFDEAEAWLLCGLYISPNSSAFLGNYAMFLTDIRQDHDQAEIYFQRALEQHPDNGATLGNYANFLRSIRQNYDKAEEYYQRALEINPKDGVALGNYASFLTDIRKDNAKAEVLFHGALDIDDTDEGLLTNFANFLRDILQDYDRAEDFYRRALLANPRDAYTLGSYASFLTYKRLDDTKAEEYYVQALAADDKHTGNLSNYAIFLSTVRKDFQKADVYMRKAIELEPDDPDYLMNHAAILLMNGLTDEGRAALSLAAAMPNLSEGQQMDIAFERYIHFPMEIPSPLSKLKRDLQMGKRAKGHIFDVNIDRALQDNHPNVPLLKALASVIKDEDPLKSLDAFPEWRVA